LGKPTIKVNIVVPVTPEYKVGGGESNNHSIPSAPLVAIDEIQPQPLSAIEEKNNDINSEDRTVVHWIQGLDRVVFHKDTCCAQEIRLLGWKPPRYIWFALSGAICDIIQLGMLYLLHVYLLPTHIDTSISWMVAFCTSILFRHTSHRFFVFGTYVGGYTQSLIRIYMGYSVTIVLSTILNYILNRILAVNLFVLALLTMAWTGIVNYFILKYFWNIGSNSSNGNHKSVQTMVTNTSHTSTTGSNSTSTMMTTGSHGNKLSKRSVDVMDAQQSNTATTINHTKS
jgi:putative flippase GtrA